jgi:multidrug efflux pump subunit AcrB
VRLEVAPPAPALLVPDASVLTIIPVVAIPVSLVGAFSILAALGTSINNLSLFGLVLAVGIVVDDAIVVVENVERNMRLGMSPSEAAHRTMDEVSGALIAIILVVYVGLISLTRLQFARMPTGFIPDQDIGYLVTVGQLPPDSSLARTDAMVREVNDIILKTPGVEHTSPVTGFDVTTNTVAPNAATIFFSLPSLYGHEIPGVNAATSLAAVRKRLAVVKDAFVLVINPTLLHVFLSRQSRRPHTKRNFEYGKKLCLLVGGSARAHHEERWTSTKKQRVLQYQFSRKTSCNRILESFLFVE